jgi:hypothetical protein
MMLDQRIVYRFLLDEWIRPWSLKHFVIQAGILFQH